MRCLQELYEIYNTCLVQSDSAFVRTRIKTSIAKSVKRVEYDIPHYFLFDTL